MPVYSFWDWGFFLYYFKHMFFCRQLVFLCEQDLDTTIKGKYTCVNLPRVMLPLLKSPKVCLPSLILPKVYQLWAKISILNLTVKSNLGKVSWVETWLKLPG